MTPERLSEITEHDSSDQHYNRAHLTEAQAERHELLVELQRMRNLIAEYEGAITWGVTCLGCSKELDVHYDGYVKGFQAAIREMKGKFEVSKTNAEIWDDVYRRGTDVL